MDALKNRLSSFFDWTPVRNNYQSQAQTWVPLIDVITTGDEYLIRVDLPGVNKNDLSVMLEGGYLVIKCARPVEQLAKGCQYLLNERPCGTFARMMQMPSDADATRIHAEFKNGVLTVHVAKDEKAKPRAIAINE